MKSELLLNRYRLVEDPVEGKFTDNFKAYDTQMERFVLIKKIKTKPKTAYRALREAHTASLIKHPNILRVYDFLKNEDNFYLTFELVKGILLSEILKNSIGLKTHQATAVAVQVCLALESAHLNNVIHRNITPSNIMILSSGRVKLMDLGVSRLLGPYGITPEGDFLGTISYMSPEQVSGNMVESSTDIFSLGSVLYEMFTGKPPFETETDKGMIFKTLNSNPIPPAKINSRVSEQLSQVVLKFLEKAPENRFSNIVEFRYKLERFLPADTSPSLILRPLALSNRSLKKSSFKITEQFKKTRYLIAPFVTFFFSLMAMRFFSFSSTSQVLLPLILLICGFVFPKTKIYSIVFSFALFVFSFLTPNLFYK
jgi:serine/threonine-protein kinase